MPGCLSALICSREADKQSPLNVKPSWGAARVPAQRCGGQHLGPDPARPRPCLAPRPLTPAAPRAAPPSPASPPFFPPFRKANTRKTPAGSSPPHQQPPRSREGGKKVRRSLKLRQTGEIRECGCNSERRVSPLREKSFTSLRSDLKRKKNQKYFFFKTK